MNGYIKRSAWIAATLLGWSMMTSPAQAASFDCAKAMTKVEKLICANAELSKLDEELNVAYITVLKEEGEEKAADIRRWQKEWIRYRNSQKNVLSIKAAYEGRLSALTVTHLYEFSWDDTEEKRMATVYTSGSIDMRKPGHPFTLKEGKGVEVCEIYQKNLEVLGNPNLACERKVSSEYEGIIKLPEWRKLDLWESRNLWTQVQKMANGGVNSPGRIESKDTTWDDQYQIDRLARQYQKYGEQYHKEVYKLDVAEMDVDNDGKIDQVLHERSGLCGEHRTYKSIALFVLNDKGDAVDLQKSRPLFQDSESNRWPKEVQRNGIFGNGSMYDVFLYKDKTYFDRWTWSGIWIYQISDGETHAICHLN